MERLSYSCRCALIVELANHLRAQGSWCGETHLQKAMFILQDVAKSNFGYKYVIYKHGPYSFEFNSELSAARAAGIIEFNFSRDGYGPNIAPTDFGKRLLETHMENIREFLKPLKFVTEWFASNDVKYLEKVATAYYITRKNPREPALERARKLNSLKPHVDVQAAEEAVRIVDAKRNEAKDRLGTIAA